MGMTLRISRSLVEQIVSEALQSEVEICGLLLGKERVIQALVPCANVHPTPATHFELDPAALFRAHRAARSGEATVIGHYHSHPSGNAAPSSTDAACAPPDGAFWIIAAAGDITAWQAVRDGAVHGRFDPVALAIAP